MKILSVAFKNINSLKGEHKIDFTAEDFSQNPLFAITGPTGSGKTTILDVICLALFNEVPRLGKITSTVVAEKGAVLTRNQKEAYAQVNYVCKKGKFTSIWNIHISKSGNVQPYTMEVFDIETKKRLDLKNSEVPSKNEALIGLNYGQFIKSVILAQGEFAKFLNAKRKERSELLEQITGTGIYRDLGRRAYRKFKDENQAIENQVNILESNKLDLLSNEKRKTLEEQLETYQRKIEDRNKQFDHIKTQLALHKDIQGLQARIDERTEALSIELKKKEEFGRNYGKLMDNHKNIYVYSAEIQSWKHRLESLRELEDERDKLKEKEKQQNEDSNKLFNQIREFIGQEIDAKEASEELNKFYKKVKDLLDERTEISQEYKSELRAFEQAVEELKLSLSPIELSKKPDEWNKILRENDIQKRGLEQKFKSQFPDNVGEAIDKTSTLLNAFNKGKSEYTILDVLKKDVVKLYKQADELTEKLKGLPDKIRETSHQVKLFDTERKNLRLEQKNQLIQGQLEDYRNQLEENEPCPLCGSEHHPYAHEMPAKKSGIDEKLQKKEDELDKAKNTLASLTTQKTAYQEQKYKADKELEIREKELEKQGTKFLENYSDKANWEKRDWDDAIEEKTKYLKLLNQLKEFDHKNKIIDKANPIYKRIAESIKKGRAKVKGIQTYYTGKNLEGDVRKYETDWQEKKSAIKNTQEYKEQLERKYKKLATNVDTSKNVLLPKLKRLGFNDLKAAERALLPSNRYDELVEKEKGIEDLVKSLKTEIKTHNAQQSERKSQLKITKDTEAIEKDKNEIERELKELNEKGKEFQRLLKNDDNLIERIKEQKKVIGDKQEENRRWKLLNDLIGSATGDKFNQFAQDLTLRQLLKLANKHLENINERYRLSTDTEATHDSPKDNLVVVDLDMGGQERSVQTLSGGESFLLSLSLALALSDLASKNINIQSLFIDEGFGTLDSETLDQTLDTLERLQASSAKSIGIISHVESLKERIGTQIQLEKNGQGYSSLKIISK